MFLIWLLSQSPVAAYNASGHFGTLRAVLTKAEPALNREEVQVIEFCSYLPDVSFELDAVHLSGWRYLCGGDARQRNAVVELLHSLTGGNAAAMTDSAKIIVTRLLAQATQIGAADSTNNLCAVGFALHLLGDTFSHRGMGSSFWDTPSSQLYGKRIGHSITGIAPDCILYDDDRTKLWEEYSLALPIFFGRAVGAPAMSLIVERVKQVTKRTRRYGYGEDGVFGALLAEVVEPFAAAFRSNEHALCQDFVRSHWVGGRERAPDCKETWRIFRTVAEAEIRRCLSCGASKEYVDPPFGTDPTCTAKAPFDTIYKSAVINLGGADPRESTGGPKPLLVRSPSLTPTLSSTFTPTVSPTRSPTTSPTAEPPPGDKPGVHPLGITPGGHASSDKPGGPPLGVTPGEHAPSGKPGEQPPAVAPGGPSPKLEPPVPGEPGAGARTDSPSLYFDTNVATTTDLERMRAWARSGVRHGKYLSIGYCDRTGSDTYNFCLGARRASFGKQVALKGVRTLRRQDIVVATCGRLYPANDANNPEALSENRRALLRPCSNPNCSDALPEGCMFESAINWDCRRQGVGGR
jgi:outer membrane protein OmpA-like peptidoglycan-associated protein